MSRKALAICIAMLWLVSLLSYASASPNYEVYVLFHEGTSMNNITYMLNDLGSVDGVSIMVNLYDNTTEAMDDAINRLESYLSQLGNYKVVVQAIYCFPYGYMSHHWQFELSSFTEEFYTKWYGKLDACLANYDNVKLFVGFNEAYFSFSKDDAKTLMQREYTIWKNISTIPFSCEITFPFYLWHNHFNVSDPNFEADVLPIWQNYSDYIGFNLIAYRYSPLYGVDPEGSNQTKEAVLTALYYGELYDKPVHVDEVLCWYPQDFQFVADSLMKDPQITAVYKLWDWSNSTEAIYALYNINVENGTITRVSPTWNVFQQIFNPSPTATPIDESNPKWYENTTTFGIVILCIFLAVYFFVKLEK
jgi:hypothetical protein